MEVELFSLNVVHPLELRGKSAFRDYSWDNKLDSWDFTFVRWSDTMELYLDRRASCETLVPAISDNDDRQTLRSIESIV